MYKKASGSQNRKKKAEKDENFEKIKEKLMKLDTYVLSSKVDSSAKIEEILTTSTADPNTSSDTVEPPTVCEDVTQSRSNQISDINATGNNDTCRNSLMHDDMLSDDEISPAESVKYKDCGTWPDVRSNKLIDHLIKLGPVHITMNEYPVNEEGRHFSNCFYKRKLPNGEVYTRRWLVYSSSKDVVFCFCCRLFDPHPKSNSKFVIGGYNKWNHFSYSIKTHENSATHKKCYIQWMETEMRINKGMTIDKEEQKLIEKESARWRNVLERLMNIAIFLAKNNMAFRGRSDTLYTPNNGKFLGLVEFLAKFDPVMQHHVELAMKGDISDHYCGKRIQNELIDLLSAKVGSIIISQVLLAIYYAIIADCTPDVSRKEQLSLTIRFVDISTDIVQIKEHFLGFYAVNDSTGAALTDFLIQALTKHGLQISNCRGQGYDNGANMKGKNNGVQKRILDMNPLAFYMLVGLIL